MLKTVKLAEIRDREISTRRLKPEHVLDLAESIMELGLLQPLVVSASNTLIAGGHRLAALKLLFGDEPSLAWRQLCEAAGKDLPVFAKRIESLRAPVAIGQNAIPVVVADRTFGELGALQMELAENEHRRDYTQDEIAAVIERLRAAGYVERSGPLRSGEKSLKLAVANALGKSRRTAERLLSSHRKAGGRPRLEESGGRRSLVISVEPSLDDELRALAEKKSTSLSELCRGLLRKGLARDGQ